MSLLSQDISRSLKSVFGFDKFKGNQEAIVENLLQGNNTFVIMPTGGGKSLCYQLPAMMQEGTAIVVSPLIALMKNQVDTLRGVSEENGIAHVLNSSLTKKEVVQVKADLMNGVTKLLYVAPESLNKDENIEFLQSIPISFYAIDEAHCISEWGHDFRPEYRNLRQAINKIGDKPIIALTATATPKVQNDILKTLQIEDAVIYKSSFNRANLYYEVRPKVNVDREIIRILKDNPGKSSILYCLSRSKVEEMAKALQVNGINALPYHAGMDGNTRSRHQDAFLNEDTDVIVATIAFGMGIDKPDVRYVIHYDMPKSLESYYQETGRAGRDGGEGNCITFYSWKDVEKMEKFLAKKPVAEQEIGKQLLQEAMGYAETSMCRRKFLLHYFGEYYDDSNCTDMCDNCRHPKKKFDAQEHLLLMLNIIRKSNERFKAEQVINALLGKLTSILKTHKADEMDEFGALSDSNEIYIGNILRQAVVRGLIQKDIEKYGILNLTPEGEKYLAQPEPFMVAEEINFDQIELDAGKPQPKSGGALDENLYNTLKEINKKVAKQKDVPPFAVFSDISLQEMATNYPCTIDELKNISGVGDGKANKFGKAFVEAIDKHVKDNDIDRPMDFVVKSVANKSALKVFIIQSTDRKIPLEDIASAKGLSMDNLLMEMEMIVNSGTRVNLDYYLTDILDEDSIEEIFDYYMEESETGDITEAYREFDGDYSEEELRLVKLKFLSEVAN
ncbi:MAG: DNA helicase RecQ [Bacteroidota bacterium]|nr:DNA helicase RecQ [Bacteroidota bacterium]MDX5427672.1 DNA helicase RecQ [Bacteroidota bacterium]MDX5505571.1 DNA helicase RecQ [Bacteroidota bacterium]